MKRKIKNIIYNMLFAGIVFCLPVLGHAQSRDCANSGFENNNFTNWTGLIGTYAGASDLSNVNSGLTLNATALPSAPRITLTTPGADPNVPIQRVYSGSYALKLGSQLAQSRAERAVYTVPITNNNKIFRYNYAVVLEIPNGHTPDQLPFFWARVMVGKNVICETGRKTAGTGDPFFQVQNGFSFRDWDCQVCDLSAYVGQNVTVEFTVASCSPGAHFGYAYIDGLCEGATINTSFHLNKKTFCLNEAITMDATATVGENYYYLTLEESDANGGRPNPASEMILHFPNQTIGVVNITQIFQERGFVFKCNTYYRLKLAVGNTCSAWNENVQVIYITCPKIELGPDLCLDCKAPPVSIRIGDPTAPVASNLLYQWSPAQGIQNPTAPYTAHIQGSVNYPITYTVTVTDTRSGCTNSDNITVRCKVVDAKLIKESTCCGIRISISAPHNYTDSHWSNGETNVDFIEVHEAGTYSVTYSNSCSSVTESVVVTPEDIANTERYHTIYNESMHNYYSSSSNDNSYNAFYIMHVEDPLPTYGNYFATQYRLEIFNRWGEMIRVIEDEIDNCQGFQNPAIFWDGTVNGTQVQQDVYNAKLFIKNCRYKDDWKPVMVDYCEEWGYDCLDYDCLGAASFQCGFFKKEFCVLYSNLYCKVQRHEYVFPITIVF